MNHGILRRPTAGLLALLGLAAATPSAAQTAANFDPGRADLADEPRFDAFYPTEYESLAGAREAGRVDDDTGLLLLTRGSIAMAMVTAQMAYHHVAQGELAGEPWMVSF